MRSQGIPGQSPREALEKVYARMCVPKSNIGLDVVVITVKFDVILLFQNVIQSSRATLITRIGLAPEIPPRDLLLQVREYRWCGMVYPV